MADHEGRDVAKEDDKLLASAAQGEQGTGTASGSTADGMFGLLGHWVPSRRHALGAFLLVTVAVIWTAASFLVQYIQQDLGFARPFFITYVSNGLFSILLLLEYWRVHLGKTESLSFLSRPGDISWKQEARAAAKVAVIWFAAQGTYNWSLNGTTVSVSTILSSTSCVFTFGMSLAALHEKFSLLTMLGVILTVGGAAVTTISAGEASQGVNTVVGVSLCLGSAVLYGVYTVLIRQVTPPESGRFNIRVMFGFVGFFNLILLAPVVAILHATGVESLSKLSPQIMGLVVVKGLFDNVLSDILWAMAILLTSPTAATIGLSLTVPLAMISDWALQSIVPSASMVVGALLVVLGFVLASAIETEQQPADAAGNETAKEADSGDGKPAAADEASAVDEALRRLGTVESGAALETEPREDLPGPAPSPLSESGES